MSDQLRGEIQARLDEVLGEVEKLREALAALGRGDDATAPSPHATPSRAPARVRSRARRASGSRTASRKPARPRPDVGTAARSPSPQAAEPPAAGSPRAIERPAPGATKHAILEALADSSAMTAGEVATATGLGRASVSAALSKLATAGEVTKAVRGYQIAAVEPAKQFYFRAQGDTPTAAIAANLRELEAELAICDQGVLRHHCPARDFSGWIAAVFHDEALAAEIAAAEAQLATDSPSAAVEHVRQALIAALKGRHTITR